jgi:3-mercaptopyruvate sulfurtransferase SseA
VAQFLRSQGYQAYALLGGLGGWLDAGLPVEAKTAEQQRAVSDVCPECGQPLATHRST